jgi:hypothetical protein
MPLTTPIVITNQHRACFVSYDPITRTIKVNNNCHHLPSLVDDEYQSPQPPQK